MQAATETRGWLIDPHPLSCPVLALSPCPALPCPFLSYVALLCPPVYSPVLCFSSVPRNGGGRVELGSWTWEKSEAVVAKAPTGPPLIRLDKALIKSTRCSTAISRVTVGICDLGWLPRKSPTNLLVPNKLLVAN